MVEAVPEDDLALEDLVRSGGIETYFTPVVDTLTFHRVGHQILQAPVGDPALGARRRRTCADRSAPRR